MASDAKRRRINTVVDKKKYDTAQWLHSILTLCSNMDNKSHVILAPLKINSCNATESIGTPFSKACCDTDLYDECYIFGDVFQHGIDVLRNYWETKKAPEDHQMLFVFQKLLDFVNGDRSVYLPDKDNPRSLSDTELAVLVASHLLGKLGPSPCYMMDKNSSLKKQDECFCGEVSCKMNGEYGDTSIGHEEVWHGNVDVIINSDMAVECLNKNPDSPSGKTAAEVKLKKCLQRNPQIIAQTIVFSFLQKKKHPERSNFLTPCVGIGRTELIVMLYDSEHDILLESSSVPLFKNDCSCEFSFQAILVSWLTVNYKFCCSGLVSKHTNLTSKFFVHAKEKMHIYEDKLKLGNVSNSQRINNRFTLAPPNMIRTPFIREATRAFLISLAEEETSDCPDSSVYGSVDRN